MEQLEVCPDCDELTETKNLVRERIAPDTFKWICSGCA